MGQAMNEQQRKRWYSTGYLANGIESVDAEKHTLQNGAIIRMGEAKGHGMWIDQQFCDDVAAKAVELNEKGIKARFGHPDMCSDALGTFLGRWKNIHLASDGIVRGNLHLSSTAAESPKGDLRNYIEKMAADEPDHFGTSIVFSRDWDAEEEFMSSNTEEINDENGKKSERFKSPDPENTGNLRHARLSALHAADLVDDPAATDGMFSGVGGTELAARVSEWLDTHPEILTAFGQEPEMIEIVERYASELRPFVERYTANHPAPAAEPTEAERLAAESEQVEKDAAQARESALTTERDEAATKLATAIESATQTSADLASMTAERDGLTEQLTTVTTERDALATERDEAKQKLAAIESGRPVASAAPGQEKPVESAWKQAQKSSPIRRA